MNWLSGDVNLQIPPKSVEMISIFEMWVPFVSKHSFGSLTWWQQNLKNMHCVHFPSGLMQVILIYHSQALPWHWKVHWLLFSFCSAAELGLNLQRSGATSVELLLPLAPQHLLGPATKLQTCLRVPIESQEKREILFHQDAASGTSLAP